VAAIFGSSVSGQRQIAPEERHFDARLSLPSRLAAPVGRVSEPEALAALRRAVPSLAVTLDEQTGTTRTLSSVGGYLTPVDGRAPLDIALAFMQSGSGVLGLEPEDVAEHTVTDIVPNRATGSTHVYMRQALGGVPVYNAQLHVNVNRDGRIISVSNQFVRGLAGAVRSSSRRVNPAQAVMSAAAHLGQTARQVPRETAARADVTETTTLDPAGVSRAPTTASLMYLPIQSGEVRLVWNFQIETIDGEHAYDFTVDTDSGQVWTRFDWVAGDSYRVYPARPVPVESPALSTPVAPADGRVLVANAADALASPFGWHDSNGVSGAEFQTIQGNNVHAYEDRNNINGPPVVEPPCQPGLACDFSLNLLAEPLAYTPASIANVFYWTNVLHDVQYRYGFTEEAGNFQFNNYGRGGLADDEVQAEAQDGADVPNRVNNANFLTPPDGYHPRMQLFTWTMTSPRRDSSLDAGVVVHEYGHGISNRLVGGPSSVSCLANRQQAGEGISDWLALVYTAKQHDVGTIGRGIATYLMGQPPTGPGIRTARYSTDPSVNTWTYASIRQMAVPHGVGSVWAQAAWEVYWALVEAHGFDANLADAVGPAGNQRAMLYMTEGLMNTPCSPTFTDLRDGVLLAALDNHGGSDYCRVWRAFAAFGLGIDAVSGGPDSLAAIDGFGVPGSCAPAGAPTITINNAHVSESRGVASFTVFLSLPTTVPVTVSYTTTDGTALSSQTSTDYDYVGTSGAVVIPAGAFAQAIDIPLQNDTAVEPTETFTVLLTGSINAPVGGSEGTATITDDDLDPAVSNPFADLLVDYGSAGLWLNTNPLDATPVWGQIHNANPLNMATADVDGDGLAEIVVNFPGAGIWMLSNGTIWTRLHPFNASDMAAGDLDGNGLADLIFDFPGFGVFALYNNTNWMRIFYLDSVGLTTGNLDNDHGRRDELVINFPGTGVWAWTNNDHWVQLHPLNVENLKTGDLDANGSDDVVLDFWSLGLWVRMNGGAWWSQIHFREATAMATGNIDGDPDGRDDVVVNFPGFGVWALLNGTLWIPVHSKNPSAIAVGNLDNSGSAEVVLNFPGEGIWALVNGMTWTRLTPFSGDDIGVDRIDAR